MAILPIIGDVSAKRAESIIQIALAKSQDYDLDYLIVICPELLKLMPQ